MPIHLFRHRRVERVVAALAEALRRARPDDPFEPIPIVVGSRGMERYLRHELATAMGVLSRVEFLFPANAFATAARALAAGEASIPWSSEQDRTEDPWRGPALAFRVLEWLRSEDGAAREDQVRRYLEGGEGASGAREWTFAVGVAAAIERLLFDRPDDARRWARDPSAAPEHHRWLARLLAALARGAEEPSPAELLRRMETGPVRARRAALHVFGLSTMRPGDKRHLAALARHVDVFLYLLSPSSVFLDELKGHAARLAELRRAGEPEELERILASLRSDNGLLSANAAPGRDLQAWLADLEAHESDWAGEPGAGPKTLLEAVQAWVDEAGANPGGPCEAWTAALEAESHRSRGVASIEIHRAHGALRQCEVLRDALLRRFEADRTLEPRHVLVLTPDVATYAPLLATVLARSPMIPAQVHDLGLRATNPLADVVLSVLRLSSDRVTAAVLLDLLGRRCVAARFDLSPEDVAALRTDVVSAHLRWAWDADDRLRHEQPAVHANTVAFGLERMAAGALMSIDDDLAVLEGGAGAVAPTEPSSREASVRMGRFARFCRMLRREVESLVTARTPAQWREALVGAVDALAFVEGDSAWIRTRFLEALSAAIPESASDAVVLDGAALRALLDGAFTLPVRGKSGNTGAVQVTGLEPLRSVPFRVVALVGMDDGAFPRSAVLPTWDPFAEARPGEHGRAAVDRHLFLEAMLCARDSFLVVGAGFEPKRNERVPMSIVAEELQGLLERGLTSGRCAAAGVVREHALQPWSGQSFADVKTASVESRWQAAAVAMGLSAENPPTREGQPPGLAGGLASSDLGAPWPPDERSWDVLTVDEIARGLSRPQEELLRRRLRLSLDARAEEIADREPIETAEDETWAVRGRILDGLLAAQRDPSRGHDRARFLERLRAEGVLPLRAGGERELAERWDEAEQVMAEAASVAAPGPGERRVLAARVGTYDLQAVAGDLRTGADGRCHLVVTCAGTRPAEEIVLGAFLTLLVARAAGDAAGEATAHCVALKETVSMAVPDSTDAAALLLSYVESYRAVRAGPCWLFPRFSRHVLEKRASAPDDAAAVVASGDLWLGGFRSSAVPELPWVEPLFGHVSFEQIVGRADDVVRAARPVWGPVLSAREAAEAVVAPSGTASRKRVGP